MSQTLLKLARQFADSHADPQGIAQTPVPSLRIIRSTRPGYIDCLIARPTICLVLQGCLRETVENRSKESIAGDSLLLTNHAPTLTEVVGASIAEPYVALLIELDLAIVAALKVDMEAANCAIHEVFGLTNTNEELATASLQLMRLVQQRSSMSVLMNALVRELHYWLLIGQHGQIIANLTKPDSTVRQVARAIAVIRNDYAKPLPIDRLAAVAGMSSSAFHQHFRTATDMTPLQYQKTIRLTEARRMMLSDGFKASRAAFSVGYQSVSQFTRDYRRMFGLPPTRDTRESAVARASTRPSGTQLSSMPAFA